MFVILVVHGGLVTDLGFALERHTLSTSLLVVFSFFIFKKNTETTSGF